MNRFAWFSTMISHQHHHGLLQALSLSSGVKNLKGLRVCPLKLSEPMHLKDAGQRFKTGARNQGPFTQDTANRRRLGFTPISLVLPPTGMLQMVGVLHTLYTRQVCVTVEESTRSLVHKAVVSTPAQLLLPQGDTVLITLVRKYLPSTWKKALWPSAFHGHLLCRSPCKTEAGQKLSPDM